MTAADARRLHRPGGREIGWAEADAVHTRRGRGDRLDIVHTLSGFQDGMNKDRLSHAVLGFELGEQLVEIVNVPRSLDFWQHDHVKLLADRRHDLTDIVEYPRRIERVDPRPQPGAAEIATLRHGDEA